MGKKDVIYTSLDGATGNIKNMGLYSLRLTMYKQLRVANIKF